MRLFCHRRICLWHEAQTTKKPRKAGQATAKRGKETTMSLAKNLNDLWNEAVKKAVSAYQQPDGPAKRKALLDIWHRVLHGIIMASEKCACQEGHQENCILLRDSENVAGKMSEQRFSFENFCQAIKDSIKAASEHKSSVERAFAAKTEIAVGMKMAKLHEAAVAYLSFKKLEDRRQAVALVWREYVHKLALLGETCPCQKGRPDLCLRDMEIDALKAQVSGRGFGFEMFLDEVKKTVAQMEVEILRANPDLLGKA